MDENVKNIYLSVGIFTEIFVSKVKNIQWNVDIEIVGLEIEFQQGKSIYKFFSAKFSFYDIFLLKMQLFWELKIQTQVCIWVFPILYYIRSIS